MDIAGKRPGLSNDARARKGRDIAENMRRDCVIEDRPTIIRRFARALSWEHTHSRKEDEVL